MIADATRALVALVAPPTDARLDAAFASAVVDETARRMAARLDTTGAAAATASGVGGLEEEVTSLSAVASSLAESGFKPRADWHQQLEGVLAAAVGGGGAALLSASDLARGLGALAMWGHRVNGDFGSQALEPSSRRMIVSAPPAALGPLLLGLVGVGVRPSAGWMNDWEGVTRQALDSVADESGTPAPTATAAAAAVKAADVASIAAAAARSGHGAPGDAWKTSCANAALGRLSEMNDADLAGLGSGLHGVKFRPSAAWAAAVSKEVERRRSAGGSVDLEAAAAWFLALRVV